MKRRSRCVYLKNIRSMYTLEVLSKNPVNYSSYLCADEETGDIPAKEKEEVSIAGIIRSYKVIYTKKTNEPMVFLDVEDSIGVTKVVVFHSLYELIDEKIRRTDLF